LGEVNRQSRRYSTANQIFIANGTGQSKETANQIVASQTTSLHYNIISNQPSFN